MSRERPMFGEFLELYGFREISFEEMRFRSGDEDFAIYVEEAKTIRGNYPGVESRRWVFGDGHEELVEELSNGRDTDQIARAVHGGDILGVSMCATSGVPINFHPPYSVKMIAQQLQGFDDSSVVSPNFKPLREMYSTSAALDEGILTIYL